MNLTTSILYGSVIIAIAFFLFILLRQVNLWYWRIDERAGLMNSQAESLKTLAEQAQKQTELLHLMLSASIDGKKIGLTDKRSGSVKFINPSELKDYALNGYDITLIMPKTVDS